MDTIGLDLHKRESQLCIIDSRGQITEKRIVTTRDRFTAVLGERATCLLVRDSLVRTRTRYVALVKAAVRREGLRLSQGDAERTASKVRSIPWREEVLRELSPILGLLSQLNREIFEADEKIEQLGKANPVVRRLMTAPGVGPVTALAFVASLDEVSRFGSAH